MGYYRLQDALVEEMTREEQAKVIEMILAQLGVELWAYKPDGAARELELRRKED